MIEIDWSKAPAYAVGALVAKQCNAHYPSIDFVAWAKVIGCGIRAVAADDFRPLHGMAGYWDFVERPVEAWSGEGLPPVGTECEVFFPCSWHRTTVIGIDIRGLRVFESPWAGPQTPYAGIGAPESFRPIRPPEQVAVGAALAEIEYLYSEGGPAAVFDAGYRKIPDELAERVGQ